MLQKWALGTDGQASPTIGYSAVLMWITSFLPGPASLLRVWYTKAPQGPLGLQTAVCMHVPKVQTKCSACLVSTVSWLICTFHCPFYFYLFIFVFIGLHPWRIYGGSKARVRIGAADASLCHSHSNTRSELCLQPTPQLRATLDP